MDDNEWLADRFEEHRAHLRAVAYRMLGSLTEAEDAVQDTWLRLSRSETSGVENLGGWLTTVVASVSLNMLRSRNVRREESFGVHVPDAVVSLPASSNRTRRRCSQTRSAWHCSLCSTPSRRRKGWRSSSTTCSSCPSSRSRPWSDEPPQQRGSWPAGHGVA
jgi:DNA-directed RNA polymerase specialized sigma24 family protein